MKFKSDLVDVKACKTMFDLYISLASREVSNEP